MRAETREAVVEVTTYHAQVERGERFWLVYVPEVDRWTQARKFGEVEATARDLVAVMTEAAPDSFELAVAVTWPDEVRDHLAQAEQLREQAARANSAAAAEMRTAARALADRGLSVRDLGKALGVSYQRAHQLVNS